ncbi:ATPase [Sphingomonas sp. HDW15A]|uniref:ATPase n=1 Tax=Sphingomonas sp. HDW15A TaxID=2714942 RepID=UPI001F0F82BF|nr:ATPase [Sphingomonas sp. HDW15A]
MRQWAIGIAALASAPASAAVVQSGPNSFAIKHSVNLVIPPDQAYAALGELPRWWNKDHTYSGDSANLSLSLKAGGCFCERLEKGGGIEHMRVTLVQPGERVVMTGALGPLLFEGVSGVMDFKVERIAGGSKVTLDYRAAGFANGNAAELAPAVDKVLGEQLRHYREYVVQRKPG